MNGLSVFVDAARPLFCAMTLEGGSGTLLYISDVQLCTDGNYELSNVDHFL